MKNILILLIFIFNLTAFANDKGKLTFFTDKVSVGETVPARIIFPIHGLESNFHDEDFLHKKINESFFIAEVKDHHLSENNHDMYVVNVLVTIIRSFIPGNEQVFQVGHLDIRLDTDERMQVEKFSEKLPEDFIFIENKLKLPLDLTVKKLIVLIATILGAGFAWWYFKRRKKKQLIEREKRIAVEKLNTWKQLITKAKDRTDYEKIYQGQMEWKIFLSEPSKCDEIIKKLDQFIYKQSWDQSDLSEVSKVNQELLKGFKIGI